MIHHLDHTKFIKSVLETYKPKLYVEFGYSEGETFEVVGPLCEEAHAVDIVIPYTPNPRLHYHQMTTDHFSKHILPSMGEIDVAFIDADHYSEQVFKDFENLFPKVRANGLIMLHDTYPEDVRWTTPVNCHDSYRVPNMIKSK